MPKNLSKIGFLFTMLLFFAGCSTKHFEDIADVQNFPQDPLTYTKQTKELNASQRIPTDAMHADFDMRYFSPWELSKPPIDAAQAKWPWASYHSFNTFKENMRPISDAWFRQMLLESFFESMGSVSKSGIVIKHTFLRNFPSNKPVFKDFTLPGEGYPFDYSQNSVLSINEPLFISHYSRDKSWAYVITSYTSGWAPTAHIAHIDETIVTKWSQSRQAIMLADDTPIYDLKGNYIAKSRIGVMLPITKVEDDSYQAIMATGKLGNQVTFTIVRIEKNAAISSPLKLNTQSIAMMAKTFMGTPYGWGGLYGNRDCSSMLRDLFTPFGLWLPRNSKAQATIGKIYNLKRLSDKQKEQEIIEHGIPFETIIYKPGHVMLYIGTHSGRAMVLHNMWGVTIKDKGSEARKIVGRTVISTLQPGSELNGYSKDFSLLSQAESMNIISAKPTLEPIVIPPNANEMPNRSRRVPKEELPQDEAQDITQQEVQKPLADDIAQDNPAQIQGY